MDSNKTTLKGQKPKTTQERIWYAVIFEVIGISLSAPLAAVFMDKPVFDTGVITATLAVAALIWNVIFNYIFDSWLTKTDRVKTFKLRILHAFCFEAGLFAFAIPFTMWYLEVGVVDALILDGGLTLFYLPYTYIFSLCYDTLRGRYWGRIDPEEQAR